MPKKVVLIVRMVFGVERSTMGVVHIRNTNVTLSQDFGIRVFLKVDPETCLPAGKGRFRMTF